ncbi:chromate resistance protein ChrB domain-containing protein [Pseudomonas sp. B11]
MPEAELSHAGELRSFDTFLKKYRLDDSALKHLARIVRGTDASCLDLTPQSAGLYAISLGLTQCFTDDQEMLAHGLVLHDALYTWFKGYQGEFHNWLQQM